MRRIETYIKFQLFYLVIMLKNMDGLFSPSYFTRKAYHDEMHFFKQELLKADPECLSNPYITNILDPLYLEYLEFLK